MSDAVLVSRPALGSTRIGLDWRPALAVVPLAIALALMLSADSDLVKIERNASVVALPLPTTTRRWNEVPHPDQLYALDAPLLRGLALVYSARQADAHGREDLLTFGTPGFEGPAVRVRLRRERDDEVVSMPPPLFAAVAREAAEAGLSIEHAGLADMMPSRFGALETVEVSLVDAAAAPVQCTGFRLVIAAPALTLGGLACGALGRPIERSALGCLVDRLDLAARGEDRAVIDLFAAADQRRDPSCIGASPVPHDRYTTRGEDKPVTRAKSSRRH